VFEGITTDGKPPGVDYVELLASINISKPADVAPPSGLYVSSVVGNTVTLRWVPQAAGPPPSSFVVQGGVAPGQELVSLSTGSPYAIFTFSAPAGSFYVRVRALSGGGVSPPSNEVRLHVNSSVPPSAPADLTGMVDGSTIVLSWRNTFSGGPPSGFLLDVSGALTTTLALPHGESFSFAGVPPGSYTVRLRAVNRGGASIPSNPVNLTFPGACSGVPHAPANVLPFQVGRTGLVTWDPPATGPAPTGYVVNVGGAFTGSFAVSGRTVSAPVGPGAYAIAVHGINDCGIGAPAPGAVLNVP
jgi:hypothetical protein